MASHKKFPDVYDHTLQVLFSVILVKELQKYDNVNVLLYFCSKNITIRYLQTLTVHFVIMWL